MRNTEHRGLLFGVLAVAVGLAGCGGGGGDNAASSSASFALRTAQQNLSTTAWSRTVSGTASDGKSYTVQLSRTPGAASVFPKAGTSGSTFSQVVLIKQGTIVLATDSTTAWFNAADLTGIGALYSDGRCQLITKSTPVPLSGHIGDLGDGADATIYTSCGTGAAASGSIKGTWSLESEAGRTLLCGNAVLRDAGGAMQVERSAGRNRTASKSTHWEHSVPARA